MVFPIECFPNINIVLPEGIKRFTSLINFLPSLPSNEKFSSLINYIPFFKIKYINCNIKIYTVSGVFVDQINVNNNTNDGIVYWDLLNNEGLEIAAGTYIYHIKSSLTDNVKMGKFSIIK